MLHVELGKLMAAVEVSLYLFALGKWRPSTSREPRARRRRCWIEQEMLAVESVVDGGVSRKGALD